MSAQRLRPFPSHFRLKDLTVITGTALKFKQNPHMSEVASKMCAWFEKQDVDEAAKKRQLAARFELYAGMAFSDAEAARLEICLAWLLWGFCLDDVMDSGEMQSDPVAILSVTERYKELLENPDSVAVKAEGDAPFAVMFDIIRKHIKAHGTAGVYHRFTRAMNTWLTSQADQARNRSTDVIPSVETYIELRRRAYAWATISALVEYSVDAKIPEQVFEDPVLQKMSEALGDLAAWANDLCSFNKEQADGDYQNVVCSVMVERDCDLQTAIDVSTDMIRTRVEEYLGYKTQLTVFGDEVDAEVAKFVQGLEHYVQGCIVWNYHTPRYFPDLGVFGKEEVLVPVRQGKSVVVTECTGNRIATD